MTDRSLSPDAARSPRLPKPATAESPCIKVCVLDLEGRCRGCGRSLDDITRWRDMTHDERIAVNRRINGG
ncbi:MAG: DUF1289 domain-containing protein [Gemmatimonadaceae bacterium]|nr:DUF1289 domain-containing protein [Gemmatimonadaceae bacterium]